jgi:hypothetical protein
VREVHLTPALREELALWRTNALHVEPSNYVIHTSTGAKHNPSNLRRDVLTPTLKAANEKLAELGIATVQHITFHSRRDRGSNPFVRRIHESSTHSVVAHTHMTFCRRRWRDAAGDSLTG